MDSSHIQAMAKSPEKKPPKPAEDSRLPRRRGNAVTDYLDASEPLNRKGFAEAPQAEFSVRNFQ